jgi:membrane associated rhomboid family serine protease
MAMRSAETTATTAIEDFAPPAAHDDFYDLAAEQELKSPAFVAHPPALPVAAELVTTGGPICPSCSRVLPLGAKICVACGIDITTGRAIVTSRGLDEEALEAHASIWIRFISWFFPFPLVNAFALPIASEAMGTRKPYAVWAITLITIVASFAFFPTLHAFEKGEPSQGIMLMQWSGNREETVRRFAKLREQAKQQLQKEVDAETGDQELTPAEKRELRDAKRRLDFAMRKLTRQAMPPENVGFRWYQLFTSGMLHGGILHLAGNLLFMLVFGMRVNELVGNAKMVVVYPLLLVTSASAHHIMSMNQPLTPYLGASGAIMGLAGMYVVLFPVQKVHMIAWFRILVVRGWKIFRMRGIYMLAAWIALNDILPVVLDHLRDEPQMGGVAHWAHLGGFVSGAAVAMVLLVTRLTTARGTDLLSWALGKRAWSILGKPAGI